MVLVVLFLIIIFLVYLVGNLVLVVILFDGGMCIRVFSFCVVLWPLLLLVMVGVVIMVGFIGLVVVWLFNLILFEGLLIGVIVGSTDVVAVFFLLGGVIIVTGKQIGRAHV